MNKLETHRLWEFHKYSESIPCTFQRLVVGWQKSNEQISFDNLTVPITLFSITAIKSVKTIMIVISFIFVILPIKIQDLSKFAPEMSVENIF